MVFNRIYFGRCNGVGQLKKCEFAMINGWKVVLWTVSGKGYYFCRGLNSGSGAGGLSKSR